MVGLLRQNTARPEPPRAMNTTETAEGTATRGSEKCVWASRKPRAALCMPAWCSKRPCFSQGGFISYGGQYCQHY